MLVTTFAPAQGRDTKPDLGANAAMKYWQAFGLLPTLDKDQAKLLQNCTEVPLDAAARKLIDKSSMSRLYLHRAVKLPRCNWSLNYEDGVRLVLPHAVKSLILARLAALHARQEFAQGHFQAGWDDVTALLKLARHVESDPMLLLALVRFRIEAIAIQAAVPYLPELKAVLPKDATKVLDNLPAGPTLREMVLKEKEIGARWIIQELKEAEKRKKGSWQDIWKEVFEPAEHPSPDLGKTAKTFKQAIQMLEDLLPVYDHQAKKVDLPRKEFDAQYPEFIKKAKAANPLAGYVLPNMGKFVPMDRRARAQLALFKAALAVVQGGPERLKDINDPFGEGPFKYRKRDKGFELKSKLVFEGKPVTLTVGTGKKE
jgi:hypothetical protein